MAVLIEGISVIVRVDAIVARYPGGPAGFTADVPNQTLCTDSEIARVGFMRPNHAEDYVLRLAARGLRVVPDGASGECDVALVDQVAGLLSSCDWAECGRVSVDDGNEVSACRLQGSTSHTLMTPEGWSFKGSLSESHSWYPPPNVPEHLQRCGSENGIGVYIDRRTGERVYIPDP